MLANCELIIRTTDPHINTFKAIEMLPIWGNLILVLVSIVQLSVYIKKLEIVFLCLA